jgi:hypothetical protein
MRHRLRGIKFSMWQDMNVFERIECGFIKKPIIKLLPKGINTPQQQNSPCR